MDIRRIEPGDREALERFLDEIPDADRTFLKEDVADPDVVAAWVLPGDARSIALDDGDVVGYVAVIPLHGWSRHVGEVRIVVDPDHRGRGVGQALARHAVLEALELGVAKLVVEVIADQEPTIAMFRSLGFDPEALLEDQVRDQAGELHDLMILALSVEESVASLQSTGIADGLAG
jgi:L-amino acid N-acyltransferase YncA